MSTKSTPVYLFLAAGFAVCALVLSSCGGHEEENTTMKDTEVTTDTISSEVRVNFDLLRVGIPSPGKIAGKLSAAKINYNKGVLISSGKAGSFSTNYQKALGMGAFGADLGLAAAYNQPQDAMEYLNQMGKLAADLGISSAFDPETSKQLLASISKPDTFQLMLDKTFDKAERNLRSNQRVAISVLIAAGGWVEGLFTSIELLNSNAKGENTKPLYNDISVHCAGYEYVFGLLEAYKSNADCAKLLAEMEPFRTTLAGYSKTGWGADALPGLREKVTALRNKIAG